MRMPWGMLILPEGTHDTTRLEMTANVRPAERCFAGDTFPDMSTAVAMILSQCICNNARNLITCKRRHGCQDPRGPSACVWHTAGTWGVDQKSIAYQPLQCRCGRVSS